MSTYSCVKYANENFIKIYLVLSLLYHWEFSRDVIYGYYMEKILFICR